MSKTSQYKTQSNDTSIASELILFDLWRSWGVTKRTIHLNNNTLNARTTAWYIAQTKLSHQSKREQIYYFLQKILESDWIDYCTIREKIMITGVIEETLIVANILESIGISYLVGGSVASGIWGEMRYTQDIDFVADIPENQIQTLLDAFSPRFYISEIAIQDAIKNGQSFNLIDNETGWKIDIFILTPDPFQQSRFNSKREISINEMGETLYFSSPEDTILQKLIWYTMTKKISTQQWRDILGIIKLQAEELDFNYLQKWADFLKLSTDLQQALQESGFN